MMKNKQANIFSAWLDWHYSTMLGVLFELWKNYLGFINDFFSIPLLLRTLVSPWRREVWRAKQGFNIGDIFASLIYNTYSRFMGAVLRLALIATGLVLQLLLLLFGIAMMILWLLMPLLIPIFIFFALYL